MRGKEILQNLCAQSEEADLFLVTKETPGCLDSFALKWRKEKQKRQGGYAPMKAATVGSVGDKGRLKEKAQKWPNT